jgi:hypothetical protein
MMYSTFLVSYKCLCTYEIGQNHSVRMVAVNNITHSAMRKNKVRIGVSMFSFCLSSDLYDARIKNLYEKLRPDGRPTSGLINSIFLNYLAGI